MRYSEIVGRAFYNIGLADADIDLVDLHFTASSHHYHRMLEAKNDLMPYLFHRERHRAHLRAMMLIIYERGDFSKAKDESLCGLEMRSSWFPMGANLPSPTMFDSMEPDCHFGVARPHCSDVYLTVQDWQDARFVS